MTTFLLDPAGDLGDLLVAELTAARWADGTLMVDLAEEVLRREVVDPALLRLRDRIAVSDPPARPCAAPAASLPAAPADLKTGIDRRSPR